MSKQTGKGGRSGRRASQKGQKTIEPTDPVTGEPIELWESQEPMFDHQEPQIEYRDGETDPRTEAHDRTAQRVNDFLRGVRGPQPKRARAVDVVAELHKKTHWPDDRPMPTVYIKQLIPCPECKRTHTDNLAQAVRCEGSAGKKAYFRCVACKHRFSLRIKKS